MNWRAIMLSLATMAALSLPVAATAHDGRAAHGGLFGSKPPTYGGKGMLNGVNRDGSAINNQGFGFGYGDIIGNQTFGDSHTYSFIGNQTFGGNNGNYGIGNQTFGATNSNYGIGNQTFGAPDHAYNINNQTFGAPLGGGLVLLLGAGLGYAALRNRRKD